MKYIIDIPDDTTCINVLKYEDRKCVAARSYIIPDLTPYTESDCKAIEDEAVETIENDVWEFVRIITDMTEAQRKECFGGATCDLDDYLTYQEAKAKYEAWLKQEEGENANLD